MNFDELLIISIAKLKEDRFVWIVEKLKPGRNPEFFGYANSRDAAFDECRQAQKAIDPLLQIQVMPHAGAGWARKWHSKLAKDKRKLKPSKATDTAPREFLYCLHSSYDECPVTTTVERYQIFKRTDKKVFVRTAQEGCPNPRESSYSLDRAALERDGEVYSRAAGRHFYLTPPDEQEHKNTPQPFVMLGLPYPATTEEVAKAYRRKAKEAHPDTGGTGETFIKLHKAYERALIMIALDDRRQGDGAGSSHQASA